MKIVYNILSAGETVDGADIITSVRAVPADQAIALGVIDLQLKDANITFQAGGTFTVDLIEVTTRAAVALALVLPVVDVKVDPIAEIKAEVVKLEADVAAIQAEHAAEPAAPAA